MASHGSSLTITLERRLSADQTGEQSGPAAQTSEHPLCADQTEQRPDLAAQTGEHPDPAEQMKKCPASSDQTEQYPDPANQQLLGILPCSIMQALLTMIDKIADPEKLSDNDKQIYNTLHLLKQKKLGDFTHKPPTIYFPGSWKIENSSNPNQAFLYSSWTPLSNTQPSITIKTNNSEIFCAALTEKTIGLKFTQTPDTGPPPIVAYAHAIYACCAAYTNATIVIDPNYKYREKLRLYLKAYEKIARSMGQSKPTLHLGEETKKTESSDQEIKGQETDEAIQQLDKNILEFIQLLNPLPKTDNPNSNNASSCSPLKHEHSSASYRI